MEKKNTHRDPCSIPQDKAMVLRFPVYRDEKVYHDTKRRNGPRQAEILVAR